MQITTTGDCMGLYLVVLIKIGLICFYFILRKMGKASDVQKKSINNAKIKHDELVDRIDELHEKIDTFIAQSSLTLKEPPKPIKPNNWESVFDTFKGSARKDIDE